MSTLDTVIASLSGTQLTIAGLLNELHRQGRLERLVRDALTAQFLREQARQAGLSLTPEELQIASDDFRRHNRLLAAADTNSWLAAQRLSLDNFQARLEQDVLAAKVPRHLTGAEVDRHFAAQQAGFDRVRLAQVVVGRADVAQELASQVREEGRELVDVAREQNLPLTRVERFRKQLPGPLGTAKAGQLTGPVGTAGGFLLVLVEECRPAELDSVTRQRIQQELSAAWLAARLREAKIDLAPLGLS
jgi:hypothetical protein